MLALPSSPPTGYDPQQVVRWTAHARRAQLCPTPPSPDLSDLTEEDDECFDDRAEWLERQEQIQYQARQPIDTRKPNNRQIERTIVAHMYKPEVQTDGLADWMEDELVDSQRSEFLVIHRKNARLDPSSSLPAIARPASDDEQEKEVRYSRKDFAKRNHPLRQRSLSSLPDVDLVSRGSTPYLCASSAGSTASNASIPQPATPSPCTEEDIRKFTMATSKTVLSLLSKHISNEELATVVKSLSSKRHSLSDPGDTLHRVSAEGLAHTQTENQTDVDVSGQSTPMPQGSAETTPKASSRPLPVESDEEEDSSGSDSEASLAALSASMLHMVREKRKARNDQGLAEQQVSEESSVRKADSVAASHQKPSLSSSLSRSRSVQSFASSAAGSSTRTTRPRFSLRREGSAASGLVTSFRCSRPASSPSTRSLTSSIYNLRADDAAGGIRTPTSSRASSTSSFAAPPPPAVRASTRFAQAFERAWRVGVLTGGLYGLFVGVAATTMTAAGLSDSFLFAVASVFSATWLIPAGMAIIALGAAGHAFFWPRVPSANDAQNE